MSSTPAPDAYQPVLDDDGWADWSATDEPHDADVVAEASTDNAETGFPGEDDGPPHAAVARWTRNGIADAAHRAHAVTTQRAARPPGRLTATGAGVGLVVGTSVAAVLDAMISPPLGLLFWFGYLVACVIVAGRIAWGETWAALVLPPLTFVAAAGIASQFGSAEQGGWLDRTSSDMLNAVVHGWAALFLGVLLGVAVLVRRRTLS